MERKVKKSQHMSPSFLHHLDQIKEHVWMQAVEYMISGELYTQPCIRVSHRDFFRLARDGVCSVQCPFAALFARCLCGGRLCISTLGLVSKSLWVWLCLDLSYGRSSLLQDPGFGVLFPLQNIV